MFDFLDPDYDARKMVARFCKFANLRRPRWLDRSDIFNLIDDGNEAVRADIPDDELRSCHETDLILSAISKTDGSRQYVLVDRTRAAVITGDDIWRIRRNADHFARITGCVAHAAVFGKLPPPHILAEAREQNVQCVEPVDKFADELDN